MYFDVAKTQGAIGAVVTPQGHSQSQHLNEQQFPKAPGAEEAPQAAGAEAGAAGEAAGGAEAAELLPLLAL